MTMWLSVPGAVGAWACLYYLLRKSFPDLTPEWMCRVITLTHALVIVPSCAYVSFILGPNPFVEPGGPNSDLQNAIVLVSLSYFIFDFAWSLSSGTEGPVMLAHHVLSIFGNWVTLMRATCGTEMCATLFGAEISNPFLQIRYFLRQKNLHRTWYGELNDIMFMIVFGFMRTVVGSYFIWCYLPNPGPDWIAKTGGFTLYLMGWVWWVAMLRYAYRKYTKMFKDYCANRRNSAKSTNHEINSKISEKVPSDISNGTNGTYIKSKDE